MRVAASAPVPAVKSDSVTRDFVETLLALQPAARQAPTVSMATRLVIDGLAVGALGSTQTGPRILAQLAAETGGRTSATLLGHTTRVPPAEAARVNGAAMHVLDYEPMWNPANHSLSTTLPAVLALAETLARDRSAGSSQPATASQAPDGSSVLAALALGVEAQQRMRLASGQLDPGGLMFHPPGAVGAFGSAVACGILLGLNAQEMTHAVGIAASRAAGIQGNIGSMTKALHCGQAAMAGLEAALQASRGFTANADALGGPRGYGRAFYGDSFDPAILTATRSDLFINDPGPAFKFFPSQYGTHFVITAALEVRRRWWQHSLNGTEAGAIRHVRITVPPMAYVDRPLPATGLDGKFSFQYVTALALLDGRVDVAGFADERRFSADIESLLPRIEMQVDATCEGRFDRMRVDVAVTLADGREERATCDGPPGIWGRPADPALLNKKALDCLSSAYPAERATRIIDAASDIANADAADLVRLMDLISEERG